MLQQQNKFGQESGAAVNCVSEAAGLGEFPRAQVCRGGRQLLGLSAAATLVQLPPYGAVPWSGLPWNVLGGSRAVRKGSGLQSYG